MGKRIMVTASYRLTHLPTGKFYVGSTASYNQRKSGHLKALEKGVHENPNLQVLYDSDPNPANFRFEEWVTEDRETAYAHEKSLIDEAVDSGLLLNIRHDVHGFERGVPKTDEVKVKISQSKKGVPKSAEWIARRTGEHHPQALPVSIDGVHYPTVKAAAKALKIPAPTLRYRIGSTSPKFKTYKEASPETGE